MRNSFSMLLILFLICSCELIKETNYDTIYGGDKIVIHGFISNEDGINIIAKKSVSPDNVKGDDRINEVNIDLFEDDIKILSLIRINDYLFSTSPKLLPKIGSNYYIKSGSQNLPEIVTLTQQIFLPVIIDTSYIIIDELTYYANLIVSFNVITQSEESYYLKVYYFVNGEIDSSRIESEMFNPFSIIDNTTSGLNSIEKQIGHSKGFDSLRVELYTLSPDLTEFLQSFQKYESSKEDPFFEQTYPVFSNIDGGYGIFASYSYSTNIVHKK